MSRVCPPRFTVVRSNAGKLSRIIGAANAVQHAATGEEDRLERQVMSDNPGSPANFYRQALPDNRSPSKTTGERFVQPVLHSAPIDLRGPSMGSSFIREGDTTSLGGRVLACTSTNTVFGKPFALEGDMVSRPKCGGVYRARRADRLQPGPDSGAGRAAPGDAVKYRLREGYTLREQRPCGIKRNQEKNEGAKTGTPTALGRIYGPSTSLPW